MDTTINLRVPEYCVMVVYYLDQELTLDIRIAPTLVNSLQRGKHKEVS